MSSLADAEIAALEAKLDQAAEAFARVQPEGHFLEGRDAERIAEKLERLHSQIMEVTPPEASATYQRALLLRRLDQHRQGQADQVHEQLRGRGRRDNVRELAQ